MLRNYLLVALRSLRRRPGFSLLNVSGLTLGLACCLLLFQYVAFERSFDRFHEHHGDLYRLVHAMARGEEALEAGGTYTPQALGPALEEALPEIARFARLHPQRTPALVTNPAHPELVFEEEAIYYVDRAFLDMFSFPLVAGDPREALEPGTVLITERLAEKYFGAASPVGEVLDVVGLVEGGYRVAGVLRAVPANSHLQFEMLLPITDLLTTGQYVNEPEDGWSFNNFVTYVQLHPGADRAEVDRKMTELLVARRGAAMQEYGFRADMRLYGQPLGDVYLNADVQSFGTATSSYRTVYFFSIIGLVTLLIALVNYVNLATARALDRAREVGVRKTVGAQRGQLVAQFLSESALTIGVAALLAIGLAAALTPFVNDLVETRLSWDLWARPGFWAAFAATLAVCTVLAGLYPAFVLSSFRPAAVLKGKAGSFAGQHWLRRGLVVFQFAAAIVLIGGTAIVYDQLGYMRSMDLGLDLEQVITVPGPRVVPEGTTPTNARLTLTEELRRLPGVREVATSWALPGQGFNWHGASTWRAENEQATAINAVVTFVDTAFVALYGMELLAGSNLTEAHPAWGSGPQAHALANETAIRTLGFATPEEALDHPLRMGGDTDVRIVGVLRDFNWSSAHQVRESIFLGRAVSGSHLSIRVATANLPETLASIERTYAALFPGNVFRYRFMDEAYGQQYREDRRFATLFALFAGLAIFIACLGLFGLAAFAAQQRTKEIGIRKVLGASVPGLVALLSRDFLALVGVAVLVASPVAYLLMQRWLEGFAYRIDLGPGLFVGVGLLALAIALLTVAYQALRAAAADPVRALRSE